MSEFSARHVSARALSGALGCLVVYACDFRFKHAQTTPLSSPPPISMAKGGKKGSLKAALASQQTRLKKKKEVEHAAQHEERIKAVVQAKAKEKGKAAPLRPTIPFTATDNILLIGEGNFSFARALALHPPPELEFLPASNIIATAYDSEEECYAKYPEAKEIVGALREKGVIVLFRVDATKLEKVSALKERTFDRIVWNFPHAGLYRLSLSFYDRPLIKFLVK